jgi:uridine phosphorylase
MAKQYHIGVGRGDVAPYVLMCGDPERVEKVAKLFDKVRVRRAHREFVTATGTYRGIPLTVMGTGIGVDNTEIAVVELCQVVDNPTLIRIGSCGAMQNSMKLGDLVVSTGSVRLENTSLAYVPEGYPAVAHHEAVLALIRGCEEIRARYHAGLTATAPGFYGAQGRMVKGFPSRYPERWKELQRINVLNLEMEASTLFTLAQLRGIRAGAVCAVYAQRPKNQFATAAVRSKGEAQAIRAALAGIESLAVMDHDKKRRKARFWTPEAF